VKLALVRRRFSAVGGGELYLQRLMEALLTRGHQIHLLSESWSSPHPSSGAILHHAIPAARTRGRRASDFANGVAHVLKSLKVDCVFSMERTLQQDVYRAGDGVHAVWLERQQAFAPFWKKPFCGLGAHHRSILALERQTLNPQHTKLVIANSDMVRQEVEERFSFPSDRIRVIPNGVDLERFRNTPRAEARSRFGLQPWDFVLLFVGSGWERKGLAYSVQLLRDLQKLEPDLPGSFRAVKLLVVGKGRPPLIRQRGVIYAGPVAEIETAYAAADLLAFLPVYEPAANVVSEALAAGLPVLTTVFNGASERIVQGENGQVFSSPRERGAIFGAAMEWMERNIRIPVGQQDLSMERNVEDTLEVISLAAEASP
jgi:UDP-glucose:(heptosyl)LPS alpha-1,3-glucosyltransferase